jgi:hypothetical protein
MNGRRSRRNAHRPTWVHGLRPYPDAIFDRIATAVAGTVTQEGPAELAPITTGFMWLRITPSWAAQPRSVHVFIFLTVAVTISANLSMVCSTYRLRLSSNCSPS